MKLTIRMMLGVRIAVGRQFNPLASQDGEVTAEEYAQVSYNPSLGLNISFNEPALFAGAT